jgi:hypothetical protein
MATHLLASTKKEAYDSPIVTHAHPFLWVRPRTQPKQIKQIQDKSNTNTKERKNQHKNENREIENSRKFEKNSKNQKLNKRNNTN